MNVLPSLSQNSAEFAGHGADIIADTAVHNGPWYALYALNDSVIAAHSLGGNTTGTLVGLTIPAGVTIMLRVASVQLTSGAMVGYRL